MYHVDYAEIPQERTNEKGKREKECLFSMLFQGKN